MMKRAHNATLAMGMAVVMAMAWVIPATVVAGPPAASPTEMLKDINDQITKILGKKLPQAKQDEQVKKVVNKLLNFNLLTKNAFGKYWTMKLDDKDIMDQAQKDKAVDLLTDLIQRNYIKQIDQRKDEKYIVNYGSETVEGDKATVVTTVVAAERHDEETEVVYKLVKQGNSWKVKDIETDGVSLVRNYRTQFYKIIEKEADAKTGVAKLLEKLQSKVDDGDTGGL